jgi:hypothetical protein
MENLLVDGRHVVFLAFHHVMASRHQCATRFENLSVVLIGGMARHGLLLSHHVLLLLRYLVLYHLDAVETFFNVWGEVHRGLLLITWRHKVKILWQIFKIINLIS